MDVYKITPKSLAEGIPIFSDTDEYVQNYEKISEDAISQFDASKDAFIEEKTWREMEESTLALINKYVKDDDSVLDVGVGFGRLLTLCRNNFKKYGMDISLNGLKLAKSKGIEVCLAKIEDMPYKNNYFDVVICTDVLEHVFDLHLCIAKIISVLKDSGKLIIRVPYREPLQSYTDPGYPYKFAHLRSFDEYSLRLMFEKIFGLRYLDMSTAVYMLSPERLLWGPFGRKLPLKFVSLMRRISKNMYKKSLMHLFSPIEINMVFEKAEKQREGLLCAE